MKNIPASIRAKLYNIAKSQNRPFDEVLTLYMMERLIYRISRSRYNKRFVLKGGLLLYVLLGDTFRTTKDIDLLAKNLLNATEDIKSNFQEICMIEMDDGIEYLTDDIQVYRIKEDTIYEGVRVLIECYLGKVRKRLQIDIGFGDVIIPKPLILEYPTILNMPQPLMQAYSVESVVAEKFEAMIRLAHVNSRMKDFYDIYTLTESFDFDGRTLYESIFETFQRRGTPYPTYFFSLIFPSF
jgi:predicted nucleotidyltransferase component of viral defense system